MQPCKEMKFLNFSRQRRGGEKIDPLFDLAIQQAAGQSWPLSCPMSSSAFFSFPFSSFALFPPPPPPRPLLVLHKTPLFSEFGSETGLNSHVPEMLVQGVIFLWPPCVSVLAFPVAFKGRCQVLDPVASSWGCL